MRVSVSGRDNELSRDKNISKRSDYIFSSFRRGIYLRRLKNGKRCSWVPGD
jgi:hypothetical protein